MTRALGYKRPAGGGLRHRNAAPHLGSAPPPEMADLTAHVQISDQGGKSSCTAFGIAGNVRARQLIGGAPASTPFMSRLALYWLERRYLGEQDLDAGAFIHLGFQALNTFGFAPEDRWPYVQDDVAWRTMPPLDVLAAAFPQRHQGELVDYQRILTEGQARVDDVKRALGAGMPITFGTDVTERFCSGVAAGELVGPPGTDGSPVSGGHCMLMCGHDARGVTVANSWGTGWGDRGFFCMSWDYVRAACTDDLWVVPRAPAYAEELSR